MYRLRAHYPLKVGLKRVLVAEYHSMLAASSALSIKSRIETLVCLAPVFVFDPLRAHYPLKVGLKQYPVDCFCFPVHTSSALSIKSRIETADFGDFTKLYSILRAHYPLKVGLKRIKSVGNGAGETDFERIIH